MDVAAVVNGGVVVEVVEVRLPTHGEAQVDVVCRRCCSSRAWPWRQTAKLQPACQHVIIQKGACLCMLSPACHDSVLQPREGGFLYRDDEDDRQQPFRPSPDDPGKWRNDKFDMYDAAPQVR